MEHLLFSRASSSNEKFFTFDSRLRRNNHFYPSTVWLANQFEFKQFKKYWLDTKVIKETDYPIFFAVNQKPLKNSKGDYRLGKMKLGRDAKVAEKWIEIINYLKLDPDQKSSKE